MKRIPGLFTSFKGLWVRGAVEDCPPDHLIDSQNNCFTQHGITSRDKTTTYNNRTNVVRTAIYKPTPPFGGTNIPRVIALDSAGNLWDLTLNTIIHTDGTWLDFALVNFFGRCYISPHNGKTGLENQFVFCYDGVNFVLAAGSPPTDAMLGAFIGGGHVSSNGTYIFTYALETRTGFITGPGPKLVLNIVIPNQQLNITNLPLGPAGTKARWIIATKIIPQQPFPPFNFSYNGNQEGYPFYFAVRIGDNTTTTYVLDFFDENLINSADYLLTNLVAIPAGVGLIDYKGRMISYGEFSNPTLVRGSTPGEPESFSGTSGFIITDPSDNTGVRACVDYLNNLYIFKRQRGSVVQDNGGELSTWDPAVNFDKAIGTEKDGIAAILDAKGASAEGFIIASLGGVYLFNGAISEPELSYKIRDLWNTVNKSYFHKVKIVQDPENKRFYILVPLYQAVNVNYILIADYSNGLNPLNIKWDKWKLPEDPKDILIYEDFTNDLPVLFTLITTSSKIYLLLIGTSGTDAGGIGVESFFTLPPVRFSKGISQFSRVRLNVKGPGTLKFTIYGQDYSNETMLAPLTINTNLPGREYTIPMNLVSEQGILKVSVNGIYGINAVAVEGSHLWDERPR